MARGFNYAPGASAEIDEAALPDVGKERLAELAASRNPLVREAVAGRSDCPFGQMITLAHDHVVAVRVAAGANPVLLHSVLEYLARDRHPEVLRAVAGNPSTTPDILETLATHRRREVRQAAVAALEARRTVGEPEDARVPELRDRVFPESQVRREALVTRAAARAFEATADAALARAGTHATVEAQASPLPVRPVRPVRTTPVRGFLPPVDA